MSFGVTDIYNALLVDLALYIRKDAYWLRRWDNFKLSCASLLCRKTKLVSKQASIRNVVSVIRPCG